MKSLLLAVLAAVGLGGCYAEVAPYSPGYYGQPAYVTAGAGYYAQPAYVGGGPVYSRPYGTGYHAAPGYVGRPAYRSAPAYRPAPAYVARGYRRF
jgi:hypothetical protein